MDPQFSYLQALLDLVEPFCGDTAAHHLGADKVRIHGLPAHSPESQLARDDARLDGFWESLPVTVSTGGAFDATLGLRDLLSAEIVTSASPWTLTRQAIESASTALWILEPDSAARRMERTLKYWQYDVKEREKWRREAGRPEPKPKMHDGNELAMTATAQLARIAETASRLKLRKTQVHGPFSFHTLVGVASAASGVGQTVGTAAWRAASAFAHSRMWAPLEYHNVYPSPSLYEGSTAAITTFDEREHRKVIEAVLVPILATTIHHYESLAKPIVSVRDAVTDALPPEPSARGRAATSDSP